MADQEIIERIQKLLRHAAGEGHHSEQEVESAMRLARKLMEKHNIEEAEVYAHRPEDVRVEGAIAYEVNYSLNYQDRILATVCEVLFDVRGLIHGRGTIRFYGVPRDVAVACATYRELQTTMRALARLRYGSRWYKPHRDYCVGFVGRLHERAKEIVRSSKTEAGTTAIVLVKNTIVDKWMAEHFASARAAKSQYRVQHGGAYDAGKRDAESVQLGSEDRQVPRRAKELE